MVETFIKSQGWEKNVTDVIRREGVEVIYVT